MMVKRMLKQLQVAIYARVSTSDKGQHSENQLAQLRVWCERMGH
jgi:predicted site-specific integrase-resolvase